MSSMWKKQPLEGECTECNSNKFILVGTGIEKVFEEVKKFLNQQELLNFLLMIWIEKILLRLYTK